MRRLVFAVVVGIVVTACASSRAGADAQDASANVGDACPPATCGPYETDLVRLRLSDVHVH